MGEKAVELAEGGLGIHCRSSAVAVCVRFIWAGHTEPLVLLLDEKNFGLSTLPPSIIERDIAAGVCAPCGCFLPLSLVICAFLPYTPFLCDRLYSLLVIFPDFVVLWQHLLRICIVPVFKQNLNKLSMWACLILSLSVWTRQVARESSCWGELIKTCNALFLSVGLISFTIILQAKRKSIEFCKGFIVQLLYWSTGLTVSVGRSVVWPRAACVV